MAIDPTTGIYYVILLSYTGAATRMLATLDPATGLVTPIGIRGHYVNGLAFNSAGNLFASNGSGQGAGADSNTLASMNKATATRRRSLRPSGCVRPGAGLRSLGFQGSTRRRAAPATTTISTHRTRPTPA